MRWRRNLPAPPPERADFPPPSDGPAPDVAPTSPRRCACGAHCQPWRETLRLFTTDGTHYFDAGPCEITRRRFVPGWTDTHPQRLKPLDILEERAPKP